MMAEKAYRLLHAPIVEGREPEKLFSTADSFPMFCTPIWKPIRLDQVPIDSGKEDDKRLDEARKSRREGQSVPIVDGSDPLRELLLISNYRKTGENKTQKDKKTACRFH